MTLEEIIDFINEVEDRFPVDRWAVGGIPFWPLLRIQLRSQLDDHAPQSLGSRRSFAALTRALGEAGRIASVSARHIFARLVDFRHAGSTTRPVDVIFLSHTTCRAFAFHDNWYDIFCEPIAGVLEGMNCSSLVLEYAPAGEYRIPRNCPSIFIQTALYRLRLRSMTQRRPTAIIEQERFAEFKAFCSLRCPASPPPSMEALQKEIDYLRLVAEYFKSILLKTGASLGMLVTYYCTEGMAFNLACREIGIPSVDIQHGVQGGLHPAYGRWHNVPKDGYTMLPDYFWCWSEDEVEAIQEWSARISSRHQAFVGGNLASNMFAQEDNDFVMYFDPPIASIKQQHRKAVHVLVTLQGLGLSEVVRQAITRSSTESFWWVRLHPAMMAERETIREILQKTGNANVNLDDASDLPLYALLRHIDVHLTEWSSTVIEADSFGVPSVICHDEGARLYAEYVASGSAVTAYTCRDLLAAVDAMMTRKRQLRRRKQPVFTATDLENFMVQNCHRRANGENNDRL